MTATVTKIAWRSACIVVASGGFVALWTMKPSAIDVISERKTSPETSPPPGEYSLESPFNAIQKQSAAISARRTQTQSFDSKDVHFLSSFTSGSPQACFGTTGGGGGAGMGAAAPGESSVMVGGQTSSFRPKFAWNERQIDAGPKRRSPSCRDGARGLFSFASSA